MGTYAFKLGYNTAEAAKKHFLCERWRCSYKDTVTRWFKTFDSDCKSFDDQAKSGKPKTGFKTIETNSASSTKGVSDKLGITQSNVVHQLYTTSAKASGIAELCLV